MIKLTAPALRAIFPRAPAKYLDALLAGQAELDKAGITTTRTRLAYCLAQAAEETGEFTIPNLTESIAYSARRATQVWPGRFPSESAVYAKVGSFPGDPQIGAKIVNVAYGGRMGNRPGTNDGSRYIGRGAFQLTGRDEYRAIGSASGLELESNPELACKPETQTTIMGTYWKVRKLSPYCNSGNFVGLTRAINGGTIGLSERERELRRVAPVVAKLADVLEIAKSLPGAPPTPKPPKDVIDQATEKERKAAAGGAVAGGAGTAGGVVKSGTQHADKPAIPPIVAYSLIGVGVAVLVVAVILFAKKRAAVIANWF